MNTSYRQRTQYSDELCYDLCILQPLLHHAIRNFQSLSLRVVTDALPLPVATFAVLPTLREGVCLTSLTLHFEILRGNFRPHPIILARALRLTGELKGLRHLTLGFSGNILQYTTRDVVMDGGPMPSWTLATLMLNVHGTGITETDLATLLEALMVSPITNVGRCELHVEDNNMGPLLWTKLLPLAAVSVRGMDVHVEGNHCGPPPYIPCLRAHGCTGVCPKREFFEAGEDDDTSVWMQ